MPLPDSGPLSLQFNPNAVQSKPKHAMIVRMSVETLEALEAFPNHPSMSFDFGDSPGIHIGDTFFPVRPLKESSPHELYLRAASAAKPMAPLKLYANVIGKFIVERQLGDRVTDKVRQHTITAKHQHNERHAILLDQPPIPVSGAKNAKRKVPGSGTKPSDQLRPIASSAVASRKVSPLPQNTPSSKASADVRRRLVHCLAISPRLADDAVKMVGGANISDSARDDLLALLDDVAEQQAPSKKGDKSPRPWVLKPRTWTEVRPFEWPKLIETERVAMARQARLAFKALKIPESDPAWENVRYRQTAPSIPTSVPAPPPMAASSSSSRSSTSAQAEPKRSSATTKDAKLRSKHDVPRVKGEIQIKDESIKATVARVDAIKRAEVDRSSDGGTSAKTVASRRLPGSGYQAKKSPQPSNVVAERSGTPADPRAAAKQSLHASLPQKPSSAVPPTHARKTIPAIPSKSAKKEDESDRERDREYERQREREREKRAREKEKQRELEREQERAELEKRERARQKERDAVEREKRLREKQREREREEMEQEKRDRERERISKEKAATAFKRKSPVRDTEDTFDDAFSKPKRRKLDDGSPVASSSKSRDPRLPKKPAHEPAPAPRLKMKKDLSPPHASTQNQDRRVAGGSTHKSERPSKASGSTKPRRRSPIYTSSEDEGEIPQPRKRNPSPPPVSDRSISSDQPSSERAPRHHRPTRGTYPPATDHAALRALYQSQYTDYLGTFGKVVAQRRKLEALLNGDSEAEADLMDPEELIKLSDEHSSRKTELEYIHEMYTQGRTTGVGLTAG